MRTNKKRIIGLLLIGLPLCLAAQAPKDSVLRFSLAEAKAYALANSPVIKNAELDLTSAKRKIWETSAIGLPQLSGKYSYSYMIKIPTIYKQFAMAGSGGQAVDLNTLKATSTLDITASQLIFSGSYIVGLQTAKVYKGLSELGLTKSQRDLNESVTNSYLLVLVASENKDLIDSTYSNTLKNLNTVQRMYQQGMIEETDVDQLQLAANTLKNTADLLAWQVEITERLLKFQLGADLSSRLILTDSIKGYINSLDNNSLLVQDFVVENNVDFRLMDTQAKLMKLNLMLNKSAFLPDVAGFYQHDKNFNTKAISFTPPDLVGLSVSIPLFSSGMRLARVSQARILYEKTLNTKQQTSDGLKVSYEQSKSNYLASVNKYNVSKENLKLSEKIYNKSLLKYKEGVISSLELTQAQNQYLQSQTSYYSSILELTSSKAALEKILSKYNQ